MQLIHNNSMILFIKLLSTNRKQENGTYTNRKLHKTTLALIKSLT